MPWHPGALTTRWDPAVQVGTEHAFRSGDRWTFTFGLSLGFFRDRWWMTGLSVVPELGVGRRLPGGLHADVALGLGYLHYFWRRRTLALEDGNYVPTRSWGKPSAILPLSFTLGYRGAPGHPLTISPFVSMRWGVQGLFLAEVPAMTHLSLLGGVRIRRRTTAADEGG